MAVPPEGGPGLTLAGSHSTRPGPGAPRARARFRSRPPPRLGAVKSEISDYFLTHPGRFLVSTLIFTTSLLLGRRRGS